MSMFFNSITAKVLSLIFAIILPFSTLAPAIPNSTKAAAPKASIVYRANEKAVDEYRAEAEKANRYTYVNAPAEVNATEEEEDAPVADVTNLPAGDETGTPDPAPAPEGELENVAGVDATAANTEGAPIKSWDVSNGENDNVQMHYYAPEEGNSIVENIGAAIKAIFTPITAYAAEEDANYVGGKVVIEGEGTTEQMLFMNWLNYGKFVDDYEAWCLANGVLKNDYYIARTNIDSEGRYIGKCVSKAVAHKAVSGLGAEVQDEELLNRYLPVYMREFIAATDNFWGIYGKYTPTEVEIRGDITKINFAAFIYCTNIEKVTITANITDIGACAFAYTNIEEIRIPATIKNIGASAFSDCKVLEEVYVSGEDLETFGNAVFYNPNVNLTIYCETVDNFYCIAGMPEEASVPSTISLIEDHESEEPGEEMETPDENEEPAEPVNPWARYAGDSNSTAFVVLNPDMFVA